MILKINNSISNLDYKLRNPRESILKDFFPHQTENLLAILVS